MTRQQNKAVDTLLRMWLDSGPLPREEIVGRTVRGMNATIPRRPKPLHPLNVGAPAPTPPVLIDADDVERRLTAMINRREVSFTSDGLKSRVP